MSVGVVIGRFQVDGLHECHLKLLNYVKQTHDHMLILLGVRPTPPTRDDPLGFELRSQMLKAYYPDATILPVIDRSDDAVWSSQVDELIEMSFPPQDTTLYGGRDSFIPHYKGVHPVKELSFDAGMDISGSAIRSKIALSPLSDENGATLTRPALRYHGGKWRLAPFIIQHFPPHTCYVEPFGGAASVLLRKTPAYLEVYNDLNGDVVNFFKVLRERPVDLITAVDRTPYSRSEFLQAQEPCTDELERARRFCIWSWQGRGHAGVKEPGGWRFMSRNTRSQTPVYDWNNNQHLWAVAKRLKEVQIENGDALTIIKRYDEPTTLFYVDPPYVQDSRGKRWSNCAYINEYSDDDHRALAGMLYSAKGMVVVSGYPSALYNDIYRDWQKVERKACKDNGIKTAVECLWLSPSCLNVEDLTVSA